MDDQTDMIQKVIIVLGAQNDESGKLSLMGLARADGALAEYAKNPGSKFVLTGGFGKFNSTSLPHAHYVSEYLTSKGIPQEVILAIVPSANTVEDAILTHQFLAGIETSEIVVVTSEFHLPRARLIFECFFEKNILSFVGTPNMEGNLSLPALIEHEKAAIMKIERQGGVYVDGKLFRIV